MMKDRSIKSRFVAGAECTYCQVVDRLVIDLDLEGRVLRRRCLACGKEEEMSLDVVIGEPQERSPTVIRTRQVE